MPSARQVDYQDTDEVFFTVIKVSLQENQDMVVTIVFMQRYGRAWAIAQKRVAFRSAGK